MLKDRKAVAGFFSDIPALLAILIALSIFSVSVFNAQQNFEKQKSSEDMKEKADDFLDVVLTSQFTKNKGRFQADKLVNLNVSSVQKFYPPNSLGFQYNLTIEDNSQYEHSYSCSFQTSSKPALGDIYSASSPINIEEENGNSHIGTVTVFIWGVER